MKLMSLLLLAGLALPGSAIALDDSELENLYLQSCQLGVKKNRPVMGAEQVDALCTCRLAFLDAQFSDDTVRLIAEAQLADNRFSIPRDVYEADTEILRNCDTDPETRP